MEHFPVPSYVLPCGTVFDGLGYGRIFSDNKSIKGNKLIIYVVKISSEKKVYKLFYLYEYEKGQESESCFLSFCHIKKYHLLTLSSRFAAVESWVLHVVLD